MEMVNRLLHFRRSDIFFKLGTVIGSQSLLSNVTQCAFLLDVGNVSNIIDFNYSPRLKCVMIWFIRGLIVASRYIPFTTVWLT